MRKEWLTPRGTGSMPRDTVEDILRKRRALVREYNAADRDYQKFKGYAYRVRVRAVLNKIEDIDIRLAKMGLNPDGVSTHSFVSRPEW